MRVVNDWGAGVRRYLGWFTIVTPVVLAMCISAKAEELAMPFVCSQAIGGAIELKRGAETNYSIIGKRDEQPFSWCRGGAASGCETLMVHRFAISCGGAKVAFSRIAEAARSLGIAMPNDLPAGFAPVGQLAGRFILPSLTSAPRHVAPRVTTQDLPADSVREAVEVETPVGEVQLASPTNTQSWQTAVSADIMPDAVNTVLPVAAVMLGALSVLFGASMFAAGRWRLPAMPQEGLFNGAAVAVNSLRSHFRSATARMANAWQSASAEPADVALGNAVAMVEARLAEVELTVSGLPTDLLLRDVLNGEVGRVRERFLAAQNESRRRPFDKTAAILRALLKELDRIQRIAHSAAVSGRAAHEAARQEDFALPRSLAEAYRILGINPDATPGSAKKLIDALRLSWHPDHARDEADRLRREERMKQINVAWDMINGRRAAA